MRSILKFFIILSSVISFSVQAEEPTPKTLDELKAAIEKIREVTKTPAVGIALVDKNGIQWVDGLGEVNLETHADADEDTLFRIGSVSKMFAALAVLKLQEEGKLNLNDKVRDLAPEIYFENQWEETHPVRLVHLLEHTTGWDDIHLAEYAYSAPDSMTTKEGLDYHPDSRKSRWVPGTRHAYCNSGAGVVAYIVEKITGKQYETYIEETFFKSINMQSTSYFKTNLYEQKGATLYTNNKPEDYWHIIYRAAGSINSSPKDMANFLQFLLMRGATSNQQLISTASIDRMEIPETTLANQLGVKAGYGLANYTSGYNDFNIAFRGHNGGVFGGLTELSYSNQLQSGYVVMINAGNGMALDKISKTIRGYLTQDYKVVKPEAIALPEKFKTLNGYYAPINYRNQMSLLMIATFGVMKFSTDDKTLYRSPVFGGWESKDYAVNENYLIDHWTGLPSIAIVNDPIEGNTVQVSTDLYKPVSALQVFLTFDLFIFLILTTIISFIAALFWAGRRIIKKTPADVSVGMRLWPLAAGLTFAIYMISISMAGVSLEAYGEISILSLVAFVLSIVYPLLTLWCAFRLIKYRYQSVEKSAPKWIFYYSLFYTKLNVFMSVYLAYYGLFALRTWA
ncbi:MAG: beta-lactamase family protein [Cellvibrio sp.]|nr:beta-lactamase family protein [Cellvibrio sp.]